MMQRSSPAFNQFTRSMRRRLVPTALSGAIVFACVNAFGQGGGDPKLSGTVLGTPGADGNCLTCTVDKTFDGDTAVPFMAPMWSDAWAGLDLGTPYVITKIRYYPRTGLPSRMTNGKFQGSTTADFSVNVFDLGVIATTPAQTWCTINVTHLSGFRYVRYLTPDCGHGDVGEVEFYGHAATADGAAPAAPSGLVSSGISSSTFTLRWTAAADNIETAWYEVFANGVSVGKTTRTSRYVRGLAPNAAAVITVKALDAAGNASDASAGLSVTTASGDSMLNGPVIGTAGSNCNASDNTIATVFDGDTATYYDAKTSGTTPYWAGQDLGAPYTITKVRYYPRVGAPSRMNGSTFQGSSTADFSAGVTDLGAITATPPAGWSEMTISAATGCRYVRYLSANSGYGNAAEVEFYGHISSTGTFNPPSRSLRQSAATEGAIVALAANRIVHIPLQSRHGMDAQLSVAGIDGKERAVRYTVRMGEGASSIDLDIGGLAGGWYMVKVRVGGESASRKMFVSR